MVFMNALIRKGFLLAGVVIAANMFAVNEMMASTSPSPAPLGYQATSQTMNPPSIYPIYNSNNINQNFPELNIKEENTGAPKAQPKQKFSDILLYNLLSWEKPINFIGTLFFSIANNYFKLWDYNPGKYRKLGCRGWRSKRFLNGMLQLEVNLNTVRGAFWLIPHIINIKQFLTMIKKRKKEENTKITISATFGVSFFIHGILTGFVSIPLAIHISNFSIEISLDSLIWGVAGMILNLKLKKEQKKEEIIKKELSSYEFEEFGKNNEEDEENNNNFKEERSESSDTNN